MNEMILELAQTQPWFDNAGLVGGILGGGVGTMGAIYGTTLGVLVPRGKGKLFVFALHWTFLTIGVTLLAAGLAALIAGQPYEVWYVLILPGALLTVLMGIFTPIMRQLFRQAEHRRLEAEEFRRS